jgi:hypothetical protein
LKDVEIKTLKTGPSAPMDTKLSVTQRVLYMDEELAVWADLSEGWHYHNEDEFFEVIAKNAGLVKQIFPTERAVVSIAATRKGHDYIGMGYSPQDAQRMENENQRQFLLIRDGDNIHIVLSPELFHNYSSTLFPTTGELESPFRGYDGQNITYSDLNYTSSLKTHEHIALSYKRLLILLCGLDHNKQLFGKFYDGEPSLDFVSLAFQEKNFNFIHDVDGTGLIESYRPKSVKEWARMLNSEIGIGSKVIVQWRQAFSVEAIPSCYEKENKWNRSEGERSLEYTPVDRGTFIEGNLIKSGQDFYLTIPVSGRTQQGERREFNAKLNISYALRTGNDFDVLCIDRLNPEDAEWYLHDRPSRVLNVNGIRMLKRAIILSKVERLETKEIRTKMYDAVLDAKLADTAEEGVRLVDVAIAKWKCANHKDDINDLLSNQRKFNSLYDQIYRLSGKAKDFTNDIKVFEKSKGRTPVRVAIQVDGNYVAYSVPEKGECDDRLLPFYWLKRTAFKINSGIVTALKSKFVLIKEFTNDETITFQTENINEHIHSDVPFKTPMAKGKALASMEDTLNLWNTLHEKRGDTEYVTSVIDNFLEVRRNLTNNNKGTVVISPNVVLPLGHSVNGKNKYERIGFFGYTKELLAWLVLDNEELSNYLADNYASIFDKEVQQRMNMKGLIKSNRDKKLHELLALSRLGPRSPLGLSVSFDDYETIQKDYIYNYSLQKSVDNEIKRGYVYYFENKILNNLDEWLGIEKPTDFVPLVVYTEENSDFKNKKIHVHEITSENKGQINRFATKIFHSYKEVEAYYKTQSYTSAGSGKDATRVMMEWSGIAPVERRGQLSVASYEYKIVSKEKVKNPFH